MEKALNNPLVIQFLLGLLNCGIIISLIVEYQNAKSSINNLLEKLKIEKLAQL